MPGECSHPSVLAGDHFNLHPELPPLPLPGSPAAQGEWPLFSTHPKSSCPLVPRRGCPCHNSPQHFPTCPGAGWKGTKPEGGVVMEKAALTQSPHKTLRKTVQAAWGGGAAKTRSTALPSCPARGRDGSHSIWDLLGWKKPCKICSANNFGLCE